MPFADATPPSALKRPRTTEQLGRTRTDHYAWLKDDNWQEVMRDPAVLDAGIRAHLEAENAYTEAVTAPLAGLRAAIFEEMKSRLEPTEEDVPMPDGPFAYGHRYREGDQHGLYVRYPRDASTWPQSDPTRAAEEVMLDADALSARSGGYFNLGTVAHSPDHEWVAFSVDRQGSERFTIYVKPATAPLEEARAIGVDSATSGLVWARDNATIFFTEIDENQRPHAVFAKRAFEDAPARLVYRELDPGFFVGVSESDSGRFIEIDAHNHTTTEIWRVDSHAPDGPALCFAPREDGVEYSLHEQGNSTFVLTNWDGAVDFQIMRCRNCETESGDRDRREWDPFVPHRPGTLILGLTAYRDFLVSLEREDALPRIRIYDLRDASVPDEQRVVEMDEDAYSLGLHSSLEYDTDEIRYTYSSPTTPATLTRFDMATGEREVLKRQTVPSGHDPDDYETRRVSVTARDGESVPVTLLMRKGTSADGSNPCLLYGYGSYGHTVPAGFRTTALSLVDRGFVYAIAHIRGSMAKGYGWYLQGKLSRKTNTFDDFVDCGRALCEMGWTAPGRVVAHGGSAGGLLVGAALNRDPELFGGVVAAVPFVDALNTMSDASLPLTPPEWPEWGNPLEDEVAYDAIASWSPYDNIVERAYPPILATAGLTDPRVTYWEPAKWVAKLRENQTGGAPILLRTNMEAGHAGESGRYDRLKELALEYAFAVACVGEESGSSTSRSRRESEAA